MHEVINEKAQPLAGNPSGLHKPGSVVVSGHRTFSVQDDGRWALVKPVRKGPNFTKAKRKK